MTTLTCPRCSATLEGAPRPVFADEYVGVTQVEATLACPACRDELVLTIRSDVGVDVHIRDAPARGE